MPDVPAADPLIWFEHWLDEARQSPEPQPTAMSVSTVDPSGRPTARIVLLKAFDRKGFVFYTNLESTKADHIRQNPEVGLCFLWKALGRQVRIDGTARQLDDQVADDYFASRPRDSQIGAWASRQSRPLENRDRLEERVRKFRDKFDGQPVPRPPFWSGFRVEPRLVEFWRQRPARLHDRWVFERTDPEGWEWDRRRLYP